ncbi:MAG: hypothetical protein ACI4TD_05885 [Phocaeicola sp.]
MAELGNINIRLETRLCRINGKYGFFHTWELYSQPVEASSRVFGIVEFDDRVRRVDPTDIEFCDKTNAMLYRMNECERSKEEK